MPVIANGQPAPPPPAPGVVSTPVQLPAPQNSLQAVQAIINQMYAARLAISQNGLASVTIGGETTTWRDPKSLDEAILFWERKAAVLSGKRRRISTFWMGR